MKVFISWSGERSRAIAEVLKGWLPSVLQAVKPYFSPEDVVKGSRWSTEIAKELEASRIALLVVTPENQEAPWLLFEAGALSKNLDRARVIPLLFGDMEATDVKGPLVQFQAARFGEEEMKRVLKAVNEELGDLALGADVLEDVFRMWWPKLEEGVKESANAVLPAGHKARRSEHDLLEEVLALTRNLSSREGPPRGGDSPARGAVTDLLTGILLLASETSTWPQEGPVSESIAKIHKALGYLTRRGHLGNMSERFGPGTPLGTILDEIGALAGAAPKPVIPLRPSQFDQRPIQIDQSEIEPV
jgi:hypothetical protein